MALSSPHQIGTEGEKSERPRPGYGSWIVGNSLGFGGWVLEFPKVGFPFDSRFSDWQGVGSIALEIGAFGSL